MTKASVMIMDATLKTVAATANLIMKRENDFCELKAIRLAIKVAMFNRHDFSSNQNYLTKAIQQKPFANPMNVVRLRFKIVS